jgi:hypothetical protein
MDWVLKFGEVMPENITLYAYLDIRNPMVAWEVAIGRIKSSCDNNQNGFGVSLRQYGLFKKYAEHGIADKFINELKLEHIRQLYFSCQVSRLKGIYFFETEQAAKIAVNRWNMSIKEKYITPVNFSANFLTKVDSEWITSYLNNTSANADWMHSYWRGDTCGKAPLVEVLGSGIGVIQDNELIKEAYRKLMDLWPASTPLLASAMCAFRIMKAEEIAQIKPAIITDGNYIKGNFFINKKDFDTREQDITDAVEICKQKGEYPPVIMPAKVEDLFVLPDLREYGFVLENKQCRDDFSKLVW